MQAMPSMPDSMGYDRTIAMFSPDGRLFQVEYAKEAVKKGATSLGLVYKDGVVLATVKQTVDLLVPSSMEKLFKVDDHIGAVAAGLLADARVIVKELRVKSQINRVTYEEPIDVLNLSKELGDKMQISTLYGGMRPFGTSMLLGGIDSTGAHLIESDPSGTIYEWKAFALGNGATAANKFFREKYKEGMDEKSAIKMVIDAIKKAEKIKDIPMTVEVAIIGGTKKEFKKLTPEEIKKMMWSYGGCKQSYYC